MHIHYANWFVVIIIIAKVTIIILYIVFVLDLLPTQPPPGTAAGTVHHCIKTLTADGVIGV